MIRDYPDNGIAFLGLLLFKERYQRCGYGRHALAKIYSFANSWDCRTLRLAVIETNHIALNFWEQEGFTRLYRKPAAGFMGNAVIMEKSQ